MGTCALVCAALQSVAALLMLFGIVELSTYGEVARRPTYSWAGLLLPLATAIGAAAAVGTAWRARRGAGSYGHLLASHAVMLTAAIILVLLE